MGYLSASIRTVADARVGDTITHHLKKADSSLPGYEEATPMVFCGLFPVDADEYWFLICICFSLLNQRVVLFLINVTGVNNNSFCSVTRFPDLRDALEKLQLNDAALKVALYSDMLENSASFVLGYWKVDIIGIFLYILSSFRCNFLFIIIVLVLARIDLTINSPFLYVVWLDIK